MTDLPPQTIDVQNSARVLLERHGADAELHAARNAAVMYVKGDTRGVALWRSIFEEIAALRRTPPRDARPH